MSDLYLKWNRSTLIWIQSKCELNDSSYSSGVTAVCNSFRQPRYLVSKFKQVAYLLVSRVYTVNLLVSRHVMSPLYWILQKRIENGLQKKFRWLVYFVRQVVFIAFACLISGCILLAVVLEFTEMLISF